MRGSAAGRRRSPQPGRAAHRSMGDERERVRYMRRCGPRGADRRGGRGCVPGQPAGLREVVRGAPLRQGRPKGAGEPQAPVGCRGYPHARLCRRATVVAAAAEAAHRSCVMSGSEWTRAEMRSAWSGPGRGPGKCPRAACLPGRGVQGSPCKLPRSQPRGSFAAVPFEHERRRARANSDDTIAASTPLRVVRGLIADWLLARRVGIAGGGGSHRGREREGLPLASPMR